jgi:hypothetical protein
LVVGIVGDDAGGEGFREGRGQENCAKLIAGGGYSLYVGREPGRWSEVYVCREEKKLRLLGPGF